MVRSSSLAIRAVHRRQPDVVAEQTRAAETDLRTAQEALAPFAAVAHAGFLHDAEKEYAEAVLTAALVAGEPLPDHTALGIAVPAWLNGLAEAASELRRHALDRLRDDEVDTAERLLQAMDDVYDALVAVDHPDALTGGLRRTCDALRAVLERTRGDITLAVIHRRR
ncbi:MAG: translin [Actinomycetota bacterium]